MKATNLLVTRLVEPKNSAADFLLSIEMFQWSRPVAIIWQTLELRRAPQTIEWAAGPLSMSKSHSDFPNNSIVLISDFGRFRMNVTVDIHPVNYGQQFMLSNRASQLLTAWMRLKKIWAKYSQIESLNPEGTFESKTCGEKESTSSVHFSSMGRRCEVKDNSCGKSEVSNEKFCHKSSDSEF